jgi:hypothetical protein
VVFAYPDGVLLMKIGGVRNQTSQLYGYGFFSFIFLSFPFPFFLYMYPLEYTGITKPAALRSACGAPRAFRNPGVFRRLCLCALRASRKGQARREIHRASPRCGRWTLGGFTMDADARWFGVPWARLPLAQTQNTVWLQMHPCSALTS